MTNPTTPLSPEREREIRKRVKAATPGPWGTYQHGSMGEDVLIDIAADLHDTGHGYRCRRYIGQLESGRIDNDPAHTEWDAEQDNRQSHDDAAFIAQAPTDIAALLAELDRLRGQRRFLMSEIGEKGASSGVADRAVLAFLDSSDDDSGVDTPSRLMVRIARLEEQNRLVNQEAEDLRSEIEDLEDANTQWAERAHTAEATVTELTADRAAATAEAESLRSQLAAAYGITAAEWMQTQQQLITTLTARVAELEKAAGEGRAALADLVRDHEDPGTAAYGALHLLSQATISVESQPDQAAEALARHDANVLDSAADQLALIGDRLTSEYSSSGIATDEGPAAVLATWSAAEDKVRELAEGGAR
ncbi:hypothetical protein [Streptomyces sp. AA1529]|uniref:hypothetical protein n=1 Tax=Streptomyces sp. AA1529 TaxID=1203257 RepID=UPI0002EB4922|nr:hypothetical protein [Streptomyces sp. AA1529]